MVCQNIEMVQKEWHEFWAEAREMAETGVDELVWERQKCYVKTEKWVVGRGMNDGQRLGRWTELRVD